jgi:hypothetical protein
MAFFFTGNRIINYRNESGVAFNNNKTILRCCITFDAIFVEKKSKWQKSMLVNNVGVTSLTPPLFIEMPVPSQGSERS